MGVCGSKGENNKNKSYHLQTLSEHTSGINCMALSEDHSVLATGSEDKTARLWSSKTSVCECIGILTGHTDYINCILIEECYVLTGSADKSIRKWDIQSCECVNVFVGHSSVIYRIICTGDFVFSSSYDRSARCWDFESGECIQSFHGHKRGVYPLVFIPADDDEMTPDNLDSDHTIDILITGSADSTAKSWNFETGHCLNTFKGHKGAITCMSTDPFGETLFTGSTDTSVRSWNILTGENLKVFTGHQSSVICLQISNKILFTGSADHTVRSWVSEFAECTRIYKGHKHTVICMKLHEGLMFTGCGDAVCCCFDAKSGAIKRIFKGHETAVNALQIVDNKLFTASHDGSLRVWDINGIKEDTLINWDADKKEAKLKEIEKLGGLQNDISTSGGDAKIVIDDDKATMAA